MWALGQHPSLPEDGGILSSSLAQVYSEATAVLVRRVAKPNGNAASLLGFLNELTDFYTLAKRCFSRLPSSEELQVDRSKVLEATDAVIAFVDRAYVHLDRRPILVDLMEAFLNRDSGLDAVIEVIDKYVGLLSDERAPTHFAIRESEIRRLFCEPWVRSDTEIPANLTEGQAPFW
jgi:hypothetical protein